MNHHTNQTTGNDVGKIPKEKGCGQKESSIIANTQENTNQNTNTQKIINLWWQLQKSCVEIQLADGKSIPLQTKEKSLAAISQTSHQLLDMLPDSCFIPTTTPKTPQHRPPSELALEIGKKAIPKIAKEFEKIVIKKLMEIQRNRKFWVMSDWRVRRMKGWNVPLPLRPFSYALGGLDLRGELILEDTVKTKREDLNLTPEEYEKIREKVAHSNIAQKALRMGKKRPLCKGPSGLCLPAQDTIDFLETFVALGGDLDSIDSVVKPPLGFSPLAKSLKELDACYHNVTAAHPTNQNTWHNTEENARQNTHETNLTDIFKGAKKISATILHQNSSQKEPEEKSAYKTVMDMLQNIVPILCEHNNVPRDHLIAATKVILVCIDTIVQQKTPTSKNPKTLSWFIKASSLLLGVSAEEGETIRFLRAFCLASVEEAADITIFLLTFIKGNIDSLLWLNTYEATFVNEVYRLIENSILNLPELMLGGISHAVQKAYLDAEQKLNNAASPEEAGKAAWELLTSIKSIVLPLLAKEVPTIIMRGAIPKTKAKPKTPKKQPASQSQNGALKNDVSEVKTHNTGTPYPDGFHSPIKMKHHLAKCDGFSQTRGVSGAHNADEFFKAAKKYDLIIVDNPEFKNGIKTVKYHAQAKDKTKQLTGKPKGGIPYKKTIYDPKAYSDEQILTLGQQAAMKGYKPARESGVSQYSGLAGGVNFYIYIDLKTGLITNFHPY